MPRELRHAGDPLVTSLTVVRSLCRRDPPTTLRPRGVLHAVTGYCKAAASCSTTGANGAAIVNPQAVEKLFGSWAPGTPAHVCAIARQTGARRRRPAHEAIGSVRGIRAATARATRAGGRIDSSSVARTAECTAG